MQIQDLKWITHTHTDYYDVCKIYNGEMPSKLWGDQFWENHYYDIETYNNFPSCCGIASSASGLSAAVGAIYDYLGLENILTEYDFL